MIGNRIGTIRALGVAAGALVLGFPLIYLLATSLMTPQEVLAYPPKLLPSGLNWESYTRALQFLSGRTIANSFIFSIGVVLVQLVVSLPAGFALAKVDFKLASIVVGAMLVPMVVPSNASLIPLYLITREFGMLNSFAGLILPVAGSTAFATLLFRQFFSRIPGALIEAARLDGASWLRVLTSVIVPLAGPATAAFASVSFLNAWHMFIWPQLVAPSPAYRLMTVALAPLAQGADSTISPNVTMAAAAISTLPVLIVFLVFQRWFVQGLAGSGVE